MLTAECFLMSESRPLPPWAEDLRRRYLRGEASMFVLHGNGYDSVLHAGQILSLTEFLTGVLLKESRETIVAYNVSTGARFAKRAAEVVLTEDLLLSPDKDRTLAALESVLSTTSKAAVILEYAETIAPAGDPNFQAATRAAPAPPPP